MCSNAPILGAFNSTASVYNHLGLDNLQYLKDSQVGSEKSLDVGIATFALAINFSRKN